MFTTGVAFERRSRVTYTKHESETRMRAASVRAKRRMKTIKCVCDSFMLSTISSENIMYKFTTNNYNDIVQYVEANGTEQNIPKLQVLPVKPDKHKQTKLPSVLKHVPLF